MGVERKVQLVLNFSSPWDDYPIVSSNQWVQSGRAILSGSRSFNIMGIRRNDLFLWSFQMIPLDVSILGGRLNYFSGF